MNDQGLRGTVGRAFDLRKPIFLKIQELLMSFDEYQIICLKNHQRFDVTAFIC